MTEFATSMGSTNDNTYGAYCGLDPNQDRYSRSKLFAKGFVVCLYCLWLIVSASG